MGGIPQILYKDLNETFKPSSFGKQFCMAIQVFLLQISLFKEIKNIFQPREM
jgi:hypothetical protein